MSDVMAADGATDSGTEGFEPEVTATADPAGAATGSESVTDGPLFTLKVAGQERQVSQDELLALAQKGDDYTRKTQELAAERQRLASLDALYTALEADPKGTLSALSEAFGLGLTESNPIEEITDPLEREVAELRTWKQQMESQARQDAIERELSTLTSRYGDVDEEALLQHAISRNIPDLEDAYKSLKFEELRSHKEQTALEAKRQASVVEGGSSVQAGATTSALGDRPTFREAIAEAIRSNRH